MSKILTHLTPQAPTIKRSIPAGLKTAARDDEQYFLGIDGGGTKTHAVVCDSTFRVIGEGTSGASNPLRAGLEQAVSHVEEAVAEACNQAGIATGQVSAACAAIAGVSHPIHFHTMKDALDHALRLEAFELVSDARAALEGALDGRAGAVLVAGTGSIAMGINSSGEVARSGGWGPTISDEGSGYDIARRALKAVISSFDGRSPQTKLTLMVCDKLGIAGASDLPGVLYNSDSEPVEIAPLAELVAEAAREGDRVAREILREAGRELGKLVVSVIERLGLEAEAFRVAFVGSVFKSGDLVLESLCETVRAVAPRAELGQPLFPPEIGAVKLARKRLCMSEAG